LAKRNKQHLGTCAYCGIDARLTEDHVIPQCLFGGKVPADVPTVGACKTCNGIKKSTDDTFQRDMLVCDIDTYQHPVARAIFESQFSRAVSRNQSPLARYVRTQIKPVELVTPSGLFVGIAFGSPLPQGQATRVLRTIVRGLYGYYTSNLLPEPDSVEFQVHRLYDWPAMLPIVQEAVRTGHLRYEPVGDSTIFNCVYRVEPTDLAVSMWFLAFYAGPGTGAVYRVMTKRAPSPPGSAGEGAAKGDMPSRALWPGFHM
jgi:HNH endonuclease